MFLYEGLTADAIAAVDGSAYAPDDIVARVAAAAVTTHPDWVIRTGRKRADAIMDEGRSTHYDEAVEWLRSVRDAYHASGREHDWRIALDELVARHQRKYKLRPMLEALRS